MKILNRYIIFISFLFGLIFIKAQNSEVGKENYSELRGHYEKLEENNEKALPFVAMYLNKAKKENRYSEIIQGYKDIIFYTKERDKKLAYANSCVSYALKSNDNELISKAYLGKGIIYYFFYKQYQPALDEYLKAYEHSKKTDNPYLKKTIIYHLGVVKSYLGYYDDALNLFNASKAYFESQLKIQADHPNLVFNNQKGYFNSLHQQIICYRQLNDFIKSDSLIRAGLSALPKSNEFALEKAYFLKCLGISNFRKKQYTNAITHFSTALPELKKIDDFTWASVSYFYIGKSHEEMNKEELAIPYFTKVDSIFQKQNFIFPEVRNNYEVLIKHYFKTGDTKKELFYTKQLLKVDSVLNKDFKYLSTRIYKEYDTKALLNKQEQLENRNFISLKLLMASSFLIIVLFIVIVYRIRREKQIKRNYVELEKRILERETLPIKDNIITIPNRRENRTEIPDNILNDILQKLEKFEQKKGFRKKGLTQPELAKKFDTNTTYLSQIINEYKGKNFNAYLNELRINYITKELYHNPKFLEYTIEGLAEDCGVSSRQNFSDFFNEINGIRPADFIRKRRAELKEIENSVATETP